LAEYAKYKAVRFADEDAMGIAMTLLDISPKHDTQFLGSPCCAVNKSFKINTNNATCTYKDLVLGEVSPYFVHFPSLVYPFTYAREMLRTYKRHNIKISGIWRVAAKELVVLRVIWPLGGYYRKLRRLIGLG